MNHAAAVHWLHKAALQGHLHAQSSSALAIGLGRTWKMTQSLLFTCAKKPLMLV
jgi:TPR repeat protein